METSIQHINKQHRTSNGGFYAFLTLLCGLFYLRDVMEVSIPLVVFLGCFAVGYVVFDYSRSVALTAILPLLEHGVQTNYIAIVAIFALLIKYGKMIRLNGILQIMFVLLALEMCRAAMEPFSVSEYIRYAAQYFLVAIIIGQSRSRNLLKDPMIAIHAFIFVAVYFMMDVLLVTLKHVPLAEFSNASFRFGNLSGFLEGKPALFDNENMVALFAVVAFNLSIVSFIKTGKAGKRKWFKVILAAYFLFFGFLTVSRTFFLCMLASVAIYLAFWVYKARQSVAKVLMIILLAIVAIVVISQLFFADEIERILLRFDTDNITTGRDKIMLRYNRYLMSDWKALIFGVGLQGVSVKTGIERSPHNATQEVIISWGIIGLILVVMMIARMIKTVKQEAGGKISFCYYVPLIIYFVFIQSIQFVRVPGIFCLLVVLYAGLKIGAQDARKDIPDHG